MKTSLKTAVIPVILVLAISCDKISVGNSIKRSDTMRELHEHNESSGPDGTASGVLITAVSFEGNYDWRKDSNYGRAKGSILLLDGTETILSIDAGGDSGVSTAADLHHYSGGHIYTEFFDGARTIYKCDGEDRLAAEGKETVRGILTREDGIYVLSERLPTKGFILRKDWKEVMSRKNGCIHGCTADPSFGRTGALYEDNGELCFAYFRKDSGKEQWFIVADGEELEIGLSNSIARVFDLRRINGGNHYIVAYTDGRAPGFMTAGRLHDLSRTLGNTKAADDYRLWYENGKVTVRGTYGELMTGVWSQQSLLMTLPGDCSLHNGDAYVSRSMGVVESICADGENSVPLTERYRVMMPACVVWGQSGPSVAMTPDQPGENPVLWDNGRMTSYDINGYLTSVTMKEEKR